jgi:hypothetical protein
MASRRSRNLAGPPSPAGLPSRRLGPAHRASRSLSHLSIKACLRLFSSAPSAHGAHGAHRSARRRALARRVPRLDVTSANVVRDEYLRETSGTRSHGSHRRSLSGWNEFTLQLPSTTAELATGPVVRATLSRETNSDRAHDRAGSRHLRATSFVVSPPPGLMFKDWTAVELEVSS